MEVSDGQVVLLQWLWQHKHLTVALCISIHDQHQFQIILANFLTFVLEFEAFVAQVVDPHEITTFHAQDPLLYFEITIGQVQPNRADVLELADDRPELIILHASIGTCSMVRIMSSTLWVYSKGYDWGRVWDDVGSLEQICTLTIFYFSATEFMTLRARIAEK